MRVGGEKRGNNRDRAARRARLMAEYSACVYCNRSRNGGHTAYARQLAPRIAELKASMVLRYGKLPA